MLIKGYEIEEVEKITEEKMKKLSYFYQYAWSIHEELLSSESLLSYFANCFILIEKQDKFDNIYMPTITTDWYFL